jgi:hypothetical protein
MYVTKYSRTVSVSNAQATEPQAGKDELFFNTN